MKSFRYLNLIIALFLGSCFNRPNNQHPENPQILTDSSTVNVLTDDINSFNHNVNGMFLTDLGFAIYQGDKKDVINLIENGADMDICISDEIFEYDALYASLVFEKRDLIEYFIKEQKQDVNRLYGENWITPLVLACSIHNKELAYDASKWLIDAGADVEGGGDSGFDYIYYPILEAVDQENIPLIKLLIEKGADVEVMDKQGRSTIGIIREKANPENNEIEHILMGALKAK